MYYCASYNASPVVPERMALKETDMIAIHFWITSRVQMCECHIHFIMLLLMMCLREKSVGMSHSAAAILFGNEVELRDSLRSGEVG